MEQITLGAGCFWCIETIYNKLKGVESALSGYTGGALKNPTYKEVCTGKTGHAEVVQVTFDPAVVSLAEILEVFWKSHDPTTLNRQGADVGTQYRSEIFYHSEEQKRVAEASKEAVEESGLWDDPIVTAITPFEVMYSAEDYHQGYFLANPNQGYCVSVVGPKVEKFKKLFADKLK